MTQLSSSFTGKVGVLVVLFNSKLHLQRLVNSLKNQIYQPIEYYVYDNGSTDRGLEYLKENLPICYHFENERNVGYASANNHLFQQALKNNVEYIFVINPDMDFSPDVVSKLTDAMNSKPKLGAVGPILLFGKENERTNKIQNAGVKINFYLRRYTFPRINETFTYENLPKMSSVDSINGGSVMLRCEALNNRVFDERYFLYGEETDLAYFLKNKGWKSVIVNEAVAWHFHNYSKKNKEGFNLMYYYIQRSKYLFFRKHSLYIGFFIALVEDVLLFPLKIRWSLKLNNSSLWYFYYKGLFHGVIGKSGRYTGRFKY